MSTYQHARIAGLGLSNCSHKPPCGILPYASYNPAASKLPCHPRLLVGVLISNSSANYSTGPAILNPSAAGLGRLNFESCTAYTSSYISTFTSGSLGWSPTLTACSTNGCATPFLGGSLLAIDIWKALLDGIWTSSVSLEIHTRSVYYPNTHRLFVGWQRNDSINDEFTPACGPCIAKAASTKYTDCANKKTGTLTVYDDGTFTLS